MNTAFTKLFFLHNSGVLPAPTPEQTASDYFKSLMNVEIIQATGEKKVIGEAYGYHELMDFSKRLILITRIDTADMDELRGILKEVIKELT
jgi:hypothetical protein